MGIRPNGKMRIVFQPKSETLRPTTEPRYIQIRDHHHRLLPLMSDRKTSGSNSSYISKYMFRFTSDEVTEMENILKETNNANPPTKVFNALAVKFSKSRHQQGMSCVRYDSVQNWFRKRRHMLRKAAKALSSEKSTKPSDPSSVAEMEQSPMDELKSDDDEASSKRSSEEESSEGGFGEGASGRIVPTSSVSNSAEIVDHHMDVQLQPQPQPQPQSAPILQSRPLPDVNSVLARLAKFKRVHVESTHKTFLIQHMHNDSAHPSGVDARKMVLQAKSTLERVGRMTLVEFKSYQRDFDAAVSIIVEKGFLSDKEKTELLFLQERIVQIVKENELAREELSKCNSFKEKLTEAAENTKKIMKKADLLEEKYNKIPEEMSVISSKISQLEAALVQAKAELEIMKGDQEDVADRLAEVSQSLESVNQHYTSLKGEEASMMEKRARIEERLEENSEEWVQLTHSTGFTAEFKGGQ